MFDISKEKTDVKASESVETKKKATVDESDEEEEKPKKKKIAKNVDDDSGIPSLFENKKFYINSDVDKISELKRYIRALVLFFKDLK